MKDVIFYSFYTTDDYYAQKARELSQSMDRLGVEYFFEPIEIPEGKEWPDICRQKIKMLHDFYQTQNGKKVFWIDIDCDLNYLPEFLTNFSSDIIGFQRGFGTPLKIGYHYKARFWEPCLLGFNNTLNARKFLDDALSIEQSFNGRATDDYFFEEAWRKNARLMSFQVIPSLYIDIQGREIKDSNVEPFFRFGASGNVKEYVGQVIQHKVPWIKRSTQTCLTPKELLSKVKSKGKNKLKELYRAITPDQLQRWVLKFFNKIEDYPNAKFKMETLKYAKKGDWVSVRKIVEAGYGFRLLTPKQKDILELAYSFLHYANFDKTKKYPPIYLAWWSNPEPGNMGDWLSPYIINKVSNRSVLFVNPQTKNIKESHYFSTGSIGKFTKPNSVVLGTGISARDAELNAKARYLFVRGPITRDRVLECGGECPEIYGDPAIILPLLYQPSEEVKAQKKNEYLLVRHFTHKDIKVNLPANFDEESILVSSPKKIENFIDTLHQYRAVITSAMHCYILCQAYGIPVVLVTFEDLKNAVHGDGMKYQDYMLGAGVPVKEVEVISSDLHNLSVENIISNDKISREKMESLYQLLHVELAK